MPEFHFKQLGYKSCTCHFCKKRIPFDSAVSYRGTGNIDDLGCWACRVPVCDECGFSTWLSEDPSYRFRLCRACQTGNSRLDPLTTSKDPSKFRYCQECETLCDGGVAPCSSCRRLVCPDCGKTIDGAPLCPDCRTREERNAFLCPGCGNRRYVFQHEGGAPSRKCRGCGKEFCHACLSHLGKAKGQIDRLCRECGEVYAIPADPKPDSPEDPAAAGEPGFLKTVQSLFSGLFSPREHDRKSVGNDPPSSPPAFGKVQAASNVPYASFSEFARLRTVLERDDLAAFQRFDSLPGRDPAGNTPLHLACHFGAGQIVDFLLTKRVNIEAQNCPDSETPLFTAIRAGREELAGKLVKRKANTEHRNVRNESPLYIAIGCRLKTLVRELAAFPHLSYSPARDGRDALDFAGEAGDHEYQCWVLQAILENLERNPTAQSGGVAYESRGRGQAPTVDQRFQHVREMFERHRALWSRFVAEDRYQDFPDRGFFLAYLLLRLVRVGDELDKALRRLLPGMAPVSSRPYEDQWWAVLKLAELGWNVNNQNREGNTVLHLLLQPRSTWTPAPEFILSRAAPLLEHKADIHLMNHKGETPLDLARSAGIDLRVGRRQK